MFKALPTSPTQELANLQMHTTDVETSVNNTSTSRTFTRIEFIQSDNQATRIERQMPEQLHGLITENNFNNFCDKIDLMLQLYHDLDALFGKRMCLLTLSWVSPTLAILGLGSLLPKILVDFLWQLLSFLIPASGIAAFYILCKHCYEQAALCKQVHAECLELTNRTGGNATFRLVTKYVKQVNNDNPVFTFSHINVSINHNVPLTHNNVTDDKCYWVI